MRSRSEPHCLWCPEVRESEDHLLAKSKFASSLWYEIFKWLRVSTISTRDIFILQESCFFLSNKKTVKGLLLIWHTTIWLIWKARNESIFSSKMSKVEEIVDSHVHVFTCIVTQKSQSNNHNQNCFCYIFFSNHTTIF